jgi:hypothetical protein
MACKRPAYESIKDDFRDLSIQEMAAKHKVTCGTIRNWAKHYGAKLNLQRVCHDFTGQKVGQWTVIRRLRVNRSGAVVWETKCDCGHIAKLTSGYLNAGVTHKCGFVRWTGHKEMSGKYWKAVHQKARLRGIAVEITKEDAWNVFVAQNRKCALTGWLLQFGKQQTASLDRICSDQPYEVSNIQWVHKDANWMKNRFSQERFIATCHAVARHNPQAVGVI